MLNAWIDLTAHGARGVPCYSLRKVQPTTKIRFLLFIIPQTSHSVTHQCLPTSYPLLNLILFPSLPNPNLQITPANTPYLHPNPRQHHPIPIRPHRRNISNRALPAPLLPYFNPLHALFFQVDTDGPGFEVLVIGGCCIPQPFLSVRWLFVGYRVQFGH